MFRGTKPVEIISKIGCDELGKIFDQGIWKALFSIAVLQYLLIPDLLTLNILVSTGVLLKVISV